MKGKVIGLLAGLLVTVSAANLAQVSGGGVEGGGGQPTGSPFAIQYKNGNRFGGTGPGSSGQVLTSRGAGLAPTFQAAAAAGVTSVGLAAPSIFSVTNSPVTSTGTLTFAYSGAQGDLLYASGATALAALAKDANATRYLANTGTSNNPAWAQVNLTNGVTGTLPVASGGTNLTAATDDTVPVGNGTTWQAKNLPDCQDTSGNHFNYNSTTNTFTCGTSSAGTSGSFSANFTGCTATVTTTANWTVSPQNVVSIVIPAPTCTSNATTFSIDNWPVNLRPASNTVIPIVILDNTTTIQMGRALVQNSTSVTFGATPAANGGFTASGSKGFGGSSLRITYPL